MSTIAMNPVVRPALAEALAGARPGKSSRSEAKSRLRMTRRGRTVLLIALAMPLAAGIAFGVMSGGAAVAAKDATAPLEFVTVEPGQTLWGIATEIAPNADPRGVIDDIVAYNRLASADLPAGIHLAIPPQYTD